MRKYKLNTPVEVSWIDAVDDSDWKTPEEAIKRPDADVRTVGYYLRKDKEFLYLSHSIGTKKTSTRDVMVIPLGTIKKARRLSGGLSG